MALTPAEVQAVYRKRSRRNDFTANLYYLLGVREYHYRKLAVDALKLRPGDTVVEIGCGTGLNFPLLRAAVGETGRIVGVDLTPEMLAQARARAAEEGWRNVELVEADALRSGGRWVVADLKTPEGFSRIVLPLLLPLFKPFGVTADLAARRPWESLRKHLALGSACASTTLGIRTSPGGREVGA
jgi:demethylmenaquinone methyltransferase/2-methoxy-6-polyprenyl-1,4-benzoquinol methylase